MSARHSGAHRPQYMTAATRLISSADVDHPPSRPEVVSIAVRLELELADGRRVLLLNDRGWGSSRSWAELSLKNIQRNARKVVGPDEPPDGRSHEEEATLHWAYLQRIALQHGVVIDAHALRRLPNEVVLSDRLLARIDANSKLE